MQRFLDTYWVIYFAGYLVAIGILLWLHWDSLLHGDDSVSLLAAIYGAAAGAASAFAIIVEGGGRIVLLIPATVKKLKNQGREEGIKQGVAQGLEQGREEERAEWVAWLTRRNEAEASNRPFDEPPPSQRK